MSTPDEVIQQRLAEGLQVTGDVSAGVGAFGDPAGATAPPVELDVTKAAPATADVEALLKRLAALEAAQQAAAPVVEEAAPVDRTPVLSGSVGSDLREAIQGLHDRLAAIEDALGI